MSEIRDQVLKDIMSTYGDLDKPWLGFRLREFNKHPHRDLFQSLSQLADLEEDTDTNEDFSFVVYLSSADQDLVLKISMIGPYAMLGQVTKDNHLELIHGGEKNASSLEAKVAQSVNQAGFTLLDENLLSEPIALRLPYTEPPDTRLYQALFSDTEILPWIPRARERDADDK